MLLCVNCQASCRLADFATFWFTIPQGLFTFRLHSFSLSFFLFLLARISAPVILVRHAWHLWQVIDFKRIFLAKTLAKTCHPCPQNGKSLILKEFLFVKCVMNLFIVQCYYIYMTMQQASNATIYIYIYMTMQQATQCNKQRYYLTL